jgi:hypothetical protein
MPSPVGRDTKPWRGSRVVLLVFAVLLLAWAWTIVNNIWGYNDSGAFVYLVAASFPGMTGFVLLGLALRGGFPHLPTTQPQRVLVAVAGYLLAAVVGSLGLVLFLGLFLGGVLALFWAAGLIVPAAILAHRPQPRDPAR